MTARTFERSRLEPIPFPTHTLQMNGYAIPAGDANASSLLTFRRTNSQHSQVAPSAVGCLRGLFWAVLMESTIAFCAYEAWHLWRFLR
jgi:hypothetical protein